MTEARCQDVVLEGDAVDLGILPVLTSWPGDGGAFLTLPSVITRDPDTGTATWACTGCRASTATRPAMHWQVHKTGARHCRRAKELGSAVRGRQSSLGGDPALAYAATAPVPDGIDEWMLTGFLGRRGRGPFAAGP